MMGGNQPYQLSVPKCVQLTEIARDGRNKRRYRASHNPVDSREEITSKELEDEEGGAEVGKRCMVQGRDVQNRTNSIEKSQTEPIQTETVKNRI